MGRKPGTGGRKLGSKNKKHKEPTKPFRLTADEIESIKEKRKDCR